MKLRTAIHGILIILMTTGRVWAGGSGLNVIVVVNQNSTNSVQLGNDYCEQRGVPPQNLFRMTGWTGGAIDWSPSDFENDLLNPLMGTIIGRGLNRQVQVVVLSMDIPYRVTDGDNQNSTTAALFYGFKTNGAPVGGLPSCSLPDASSNSYAYSELPFGQAMPSTAITNSFLAMMLTDTNLAGAESILSRSVAADHTCPTQAVYLAKTSDSTRNVRFVEFDNAVFENQVAGNPAVNRVNTDTTTFTNLFGMMTGLANYALEPNAFEPGALGDSLTSYGGFILEYSGQTPALAFLEAGAAGSYGSVVEPCNYTQKFPDPVDYFYQARGFSLAEAYYQSVLNPFEGLLVGEPLAAPFARPGSADWSTLTNGTVFSGTTWLSPTFTAAATNLPLAQTDLFIDGTFFQTLTNLPPSAGNILTANINGFNVNYTIATHATLATAAAGLANAINLQTNSTHVAAFPIGDRIELQALALSAPGSNNTLNASAAMGTGASLTTKLTAARPVFLDTTATGYQVVTIYNPPIIGDWMQFTFIKTNGNNVSVGVTNNTTGTTVGAMALDLVNLINSTPALESADGLYAADYFDEDPYAIPAVQFFLYAQTPGWPASQILSTFNISTNLLATPTGTNPLADNVSDLRPRNHLYLSSGLNVLPVNYPFDTSPIPDGYHQLTAVAYEGTSVETQTRVVRTVRIQNTSLSATLAALPMGTNATPNQQLQFTVTANTTNLSRIELFSTGGSLGVVTNQASATFVISPNYPGLGWHPFYAVVTDQAGHLYQTQTVAYRIIPTITLTLTGTPPVLSWQSIPNRQYDIESTANLAAGFQTVATIMATNSIIQWPISTTGGSGFYQVRLEP